MFHSGQLLPSAPVTVGLFVDIFVFFLIIMSSEPILLEYLHKGELQYELEARGISTELLNLAILRSVFRSSHDLKENAVVLANLEILMDPTSILSICHNRFGQIKDSVDNTASSCINIDFPSIYIN
jgi:hypothetical protein